MSLTQQKRSDMEDAIGLCRMLFFTSDLLNMLTFKKSLELLRNLRETEEFFVLKYRFLYSLD